MSTPATAARPVTVGGRIALVLAGLFAMLDILVSASELAGNPIQPIALIVLGVLTLVGIPFTWTARTGRCCSWPRPACCRP